MRMRKTKRGRRPGRVKRQPRNPNTSLETMYLAAVRGSYRPGVVDVLQGLVRIVELDEYLAIAPSREREKLKLVNAGTIAKVIAILSRAVKQRDVPFFHDLALRVASKCDLHQPADPGIAALALDQLRAPGKRKISNTPFVADVLKFLNRKRIPCEERTARRLMDTVGIKKKARGETTGNSRI